MSAIPTTALCVSQADEAPEGHAQYQLGGNMDDLLKRVGNVETAISDIRLQVGGIQERLQHLATKNDVRKSESAIVRWLFTTQIAGAGLILAIMRFFV
jgi:hypothetical protein